MFWVNLIRVLSAKTGQAKDSLYVNCSHVTGDFFFMEGDLECLSDDGVEFSFVAEGSVDSLGGLSMNEKIKLCERNFGVELMPSKMPEHLYKGDK